VSYADEGRVLLVDDERLVRFTISAWLKAANFDVTAVETPEAAVVALKERAYDVVLTDVVMGAIDGFMFRDAVRGFNALIPMIFLTALVNSPSNRLLEKIGADPYSFYAPKNARRDYLLGRLRQAVRLYRAEREAVALKARMESELNIAARVQHALLPPPVRYDEGVFYSGLWRPRNIVSGDLFGWFPLGGKSAAVFFGDIAGHGAPAALAMTAVMAHLKELESFDAVMTRRPEFVCQKIHDYMRGRMPDVTYVAGTVLFVDFASHIVRYLNAGGLEPLCFCRSDGSRIELNPERRGGLPMGLMDGTTYDAADVVEVAIPEDGILCLYSDGFVDLTADPEGENRLPAEMLEDILGELIRGTSGTTDVGSVPYRLSATLKDMGYVHVQDDRSFCLIGDPMSSTGMRFVTTVSMKDPNAVNDAVDGASKWAVDHGYPDELVARLELLLSEHLENVRRHGLSEEARRREIAVIELRRVSDELEVLAWDCGQPYEGGLTELAAHPDVTLDAQNDALKGSGRGLAIVQKICRQIAYENFDGLNKFTFVLGV